MIHTCSRQGDPLSRYVTTNSRNDMVVVSEYNVTITGDSMAGNTGRCLLVSSCISSYYSSGTWYCDLFQTPPSTFSCWTATGRDSPVCDEPGTDWVASVVGTVIAGVFGLSFLISGILVLRRPRRPSADFVETGVYMESPPVVVGQVLTPQIVQGQVIGTNPL